MCVCVCVRDGVGACSRIAGTEGQNYRAVGCQPEAATRTSCNRFGIWWWRQLATVRQDHLQTPPPSMCEVISTRPLTTQCGEPGSTVACWQCGQRWEVASVWGKFEEETDQLIPPASPEGPAARSRHRSRSSPVDRSRSLKFRCALSSPGRCRTKRWVAYM